MPTNRSINKLFLITIIIYLAASYGAGYLLPADLSVYIRLIVSQGLILMPVLCYFKIKKLSIREVIPHKKLKFSVIVLIVVCTYLLYPLLAVANLLSLFFTTAQTADLIVNMEQNFLLNTLMLALMPAAIEELMFRGLIYQTYRKHKTALGILLSAFLFGCMHMNFNQFIYTLLFGIYLALLIEATDSIYSSMIAHFVLNFSSVLLTFLINKFSEFFQEIGSYDTTMQNVNGNFLQEMEGQSLLLLVLGLIIWATIAIGTTAGAAGVYIAISKLSQRFDSVKQIFQRKSGERLISIPLIIGIVISFAIMILLQ